MDLILDQVQTVTLAPISITLTYQILPLTVTCDDANIYTTVYFDGTTTTPGFILGTNANNTLSFDIYTNDEAHVGVHTLRVKGLLPNGNFIE